MKFLLQKTHITFKNIHKSYPLKTQIINQNNLTLVNLRVIQMLELKLVIIYKKLTRYVLKLLWDFKPQYTYTVP